MTMASPVEALLEKNLPHVLERIFVDYLDYPDLVSCLSTSRRVRAALCKNLLGSSPHVRRRLERRRREVLWAQGRCGWSPVDLGQEESASYSCAKAIFGSADEGDQGNVIALVKCPERNRARLVRLEMALPEAKVKVKVGSISFPFSSLESVKVNDSHVVVIFRSATEPDQEDTTTTQRHNHDEEVMLWVLERATLALASSRRCPPDLDPEALRPAGGSFLRLEEREEGKVLASRCDPAAGMASAGDRMEVWDDRRHGCGAGMRHFAVDRAHLAVGCLHGHLRLYHHVRRVETRLRPRVGDRGIKCGGSATAIALRYDCVNVSLGGGNVCAAFSTSREFEDEISVWVFRAEDGNELMSTTVTSRRMARLTISKDYFVAAYHRNVHSDSDIITLEIHDLRGGDGDGDLRRRRPAVLQLRVGSFHFARLEQLCQGRILLVGFVRNGDPALEGVMTVDLRRAVILADKRRKRGRWPELPAGVRLFPKEEGHFSSVAMAVVGQGSWAVTAAAPSWTDGELSRPPQGGLVVVWPEDCINLDEGNL